jgi:soluble lytic murein transglycosylase-like protein
MDLVLSLAKWPEEQWAMAREIAWCESRWRPDAIGDHGNSLGLFQLWTGWFHYTGTLIDDWADPVVNAAVALAVWRTRGWEEWTCSRKEAR